MHGTKSGSQPLQSKEEDGYVAKFIEVVADFSFGKARKQIKAMVIKVAKDKRTLRKSKICMYTRILEQQAQLCLHKGDHTARIQLDAMNNQEYPRGVFSAHFYGLFKLMTCHSPS